MMKISLLVVGAMIAGVSLMGVHEARADLLNFGTTYNINGDFATTATNGDPSTSTFSDNITLSAGAQTFDGGAYQITESTTLLGGGAEFAEFLITRTNGGTLVANGSSNTNTFQIYLNNIQLTAAAVSSNYYFNFATAGTANLAITGFGGLGVEANPNSGSIGAGQNAFYFPSFVPGAASTSTGYGEFQYPFNLAATDGNTDPNATGYFFGVELTPASGVPGPIAGAGFPGLVFAGGGFLAWWRKRRTSMVSAAFSAA